MRTVSIMLAAAIAWLVFTSPERQPQARVEVDLPAMQAAVDPALQALVDEHSMLLEQHATELEEIEKCHALDVAEIVARLEALESPKTAAVVKPPTTAKVKVQASYTPRWRNYDGRSLRDHAIEVHGFDSSWSDADLAAAHDAWHDTNGGDPPTALRSKSVVMSRSTSNCPGGVCPTTSRARVVQSRGGLLGFGILGRR